MCTSGIEMKQSYERTWCDYLTPCKLKPEIMVGEYECEQCPHFNSRKEEPAPKFNACDYSRYSHIYHGEVECNLKTQEI